MIAAAMPLCPRAAFAAALAIALLASCADDEAAPKAADAGADPAPKAPDDGAIAAGKRAAATPGTLAKGRHAVFGLRMPQGTVPSGTPMPGVYRFEGPSPAAHVEKFLTAQLASFDPASAEQSARLYRNAVVRNPVGGSATGPLAIRVHDRPGGAAVDVWLENEAVGGPSAQGAGGVAPTAGALVGAPTAAANQPTAKKYTTAAERRRATFEMLQKVERGEPLTKEDLDNPLFQ